MRTQLSDIFLIPVIANLMHVIFSNTFVQYQIIFIFIICSNYGKKDWKINKRAKISGHSLNKDDEFNFENKIS